jgi:hypothetical protein
MHAHGAMLTNLDSARVLRAACSCFTLRLRFTLPYVEAYLELHQHNINYHTHDGDA